MYSFTHSPYLQAPLSLGGHDTRKLGSLYASDQRRKRDEPSSPELCFPCRFKAPWSQYLWGGDT